MFSPPIPVGFDERTSHDVDLARQLMKNPLYNIPARLRDKILITAEKIMDTDLEAENKLSAARLVLEADKRNLELMKLVMPKRVDVNVKQISTEELVRLVEESQHLIPKLIESTVHAPAPK